MCVLILLYQCPLSPAFINPARRLGIGQSYCPHTTMYVPLYYYICVLILLCVSAYYYICVYSSIKTQSSLSTSHAAHITNTKRMKI
jgi:hypothetical protein